MWARQGRCVVAVFRRTLVAHTRPLKHVEPSSVDMSEVDKFSALSQSWWRADGPQWALHRMNPCRLSFVRASLVPGQVSGGQPLKGLKVADVGCGGGLLTEGLARLGADVDGFDASRDNIMIAREHLKQDWSLSRASSIRYHHMAIEDVEEPGQFDAICALEIVEHVANVPFFLQSCSRLLKPGGSLFISTMNRTSQSQALAITVAEKVMRWLPQGTHDWDRFITPDELYALLESAECTPGTAQGLSFSPVTGKWSLSTDLSVNYIVQAKKLPPVEV